MRLCFFVSLLAVFACLSASAQKAEVLDDWLSWREARDACRKKSVVQSCDLITETRLKEEWTKLGLSDADASYWVGGRRVDQWVWKEGIHQTVPLFQHHGCYKLAVDESQLIFRRDNGPRDCYNTCGGSEYLFLQGNNCYCTPTLEGEVAERGRCDLVCEGSNVKCGAKKDYFSVYSIPQQITLEDDDRANQCAVATLQVRGGSAGAGSLRVEASSCSLERHYFCASDADRQDVDTRSEQYERGVYRCFSSYGSDMPTLTAYNRTGQLVDTLRSLSDKLSFRVPFWLPLERRVVVVWTDGAEGSEGGQFGDCLAATPRRTIYRVKNLPGSEQHQAICDCSEVIITTESGKPASKPVVTIVVVALVVTTLLVVAVSVLFIFLRRRRYQKAEAEMMAERLGNVNPLYKVHGRFDSNQW